MDYIFSSNATLISFVNIYDKSQLLESEIKPTERYLMERFITASLEIKGEAIQRSGYLEFIDPKVKTTEYLPDLSWLSLDIETEDLRGKLYSIGVTTAHTEQVFLVKTCEKPGGWVLEKSQNVTCYKTEKEALLAFFRWMKKHDPDVIIGWNVIAFDLDFLQWKCQQLGLPFELGRGSYREQKAVILPPLQNGQMHIARIPG